jgi:microsomal dipeptidase-like Zn-dependent dipeptidase
VSEEYEAVCDVVRNLIDRTINTLMAIGMTKEGAIQLLAVQAIIRMDSDAEVAKLQRFIDVNHDNSAAL